MASVVAGAVAKSIRAVSAVEVAHKTREGGGFIVRRPLGGRVSYFDPFLMLDHMGPVTYKPGEAVGAPDHPHRGQTTVSYILSGELEHHDSAGHKGKLSAGWVQWMDAASGVVHSEMPSERMQKEGGTLEGFQIWVNLPAAKKLNPPRYQDVSPDLIPSVRIPGASSEESIVKVIAGQALGTTGPVETTTPILYYDLILQPGDSFSQEIPEGYNLLSYVYRGKGQFGAKNTSAEEGTMVKFGAGSTLQVTAAKDSVLKCLVLGGAPIGEPVVSHGPFVMNTEEEIYQAFEDYRAGKLGTIEGAEARRAASAVAAQKQKSSGTWAAQNKEL